MSGCQKLTYSKQSRQKDHTGQQTGPNHIHNYVGITQAFPNCIMHSRNTYGYRSRTMLHSVLLLIPESHAHSFNASTIVSHEIGDMDSTFPLVDLFSTSWQDGSAWQKLFLRIASTTVSSSVVQLQHVPSCLLDHSDNPSSFALQCLQLVHGWSITCKLNIQNPQGKMPNTTVVYFTKML